MYLEPAVAQATWYNEGKRKEWLYLRKPPARKFALALITLHLLALFVFSAEDGEPFYLNMWNFIKEVYMTGRVFRDSGAGMPENAFSFYNALEILAAIIFIALLLTKSGRRSIKRQFDPNEPDEEYYEKNKSYRGKITVEGLDKYKPLLNDLAKKAGINEVIFRYNSNIIIRTVEQSGYVSVIEIGDGFLKRLSIIRNTAVRNQFVFFAISHELIHIKYHDPMNITWLNIASVVLWLDGLLLIGLTPLLLTIQSSFIFIWLRFLCIVIWFGFVSFIPRLSYWSHCAEYRADREALILNRANVNVVFTAFSLCFPEMKEEYKIGMGAIAKILWDMLIGNASMSDAYAHPSLSQRWREAQRKQKTGKTQQEQKLEQDHEKEHIDDREWCISDYFRVAVLLITAQIKGVRRREA